MWYSRPAISKLKHNDLDGKELEQRVFFLHLSSFLLDASNSPQF